MLCIALFWHQQVQCDTFLCKRPNVRIPEASQLVHYWGKGLRNPELSTVSVICWHGVNSELEYLFICQ